MERSNDSDSLERVVKNQEEEKKNVCFDDIVEEAKKVSKDEEEAITLVVTERVAINLVSFFRRKKNEEEESKTSVSSNQISLGFSVSKRKRGSCEKRDDNNPCLVDDFDHSPDGKEEDHQEGRKFRKNNNGNRPFDDIPDHSNNVDDEESKRRNPKKKSVKKVVPIKPDLEEEKLIPDEFQREIENLGGGDVKLVLEKKLTRTDMQSGQSKLSIPVKQVRESFLRRDEEEILGQSRDDGHRLKGIDVTFIEPSRKRCDDMVLKRWVMRTGGIYALNQGWNSVVERNSRLLTAGATVQLWSFRIKTDNGSGSGVEIDRGDDEGELGFALFVPHGGDGSSSSGEERSTSSTKNEDSSSGEECSTSSTKNEDIGSSSHDTFSDID